MYTTSIVIDGIYMYTVVYIYTFTVLDIIRLCMSMLVYT